MEGPGEEEGLGGAEMGAASSVGYTPPLADRLRHRAQSAM